MDLSESAPVQNWWFLASTLSIMYRILQYPGTCTSLKRYVPGVGIFTPLGGGSPEREALWRGFASQRSCWISWWIRLSVGWSRRVNCQNFKKTKYIELSARVRFSDLANEILRKGPCSHGASWGYVVPHYHHTIFLNLYGVFNSRFWFSFF